MGAAGPHLLKSVNEDECDYGNWKSEENLTPNKNLLRRRDATTGAEARVISGALRGAEAPLFHGAAGVVVGVPQESWLRRVRR